MGTGHTFWLRSSMLVFLTCLCTYPNSGSLRILGGITGADALESWSSCIWLCRLIGIADATAFAECAIFSAEGDGDSPAGVPIEVGIMKSSRFIGSWLLFAVTVGTLE